MAVTPTQQILSVQEGPEVKSEWTLKNWATQHQILPHFSKFCVTTNFGPLVGNVDLLLSLENPTQPAVGSPYNFPAPSSLKLITLSDLTSDIPKVKTNYLSLWLMMRKPTVPANQLNNNIGFKLSADFNSSGVPNLGSHLIKTNLSHNNKFQILEKFLPYKTGDQLVINTLDLKISLKIIPVFPAQDVRRLNINPDTKYFCDIPCDIRLELHDGTVLNMHSAVVSDKSIVLRDIIKDEMQKPGFNGVIKIEKWSGKIMKAILRYIYTGKPPTTEETGTGWRDVLPAAIEMKMVGLKKEIEDGVVASCTKENMFELYADAGRFGLEDAAETIAKFIKANI